MIQVVRMDHPFDDMLPDFLVNSNRTNDTLPDHVHSSNNLGIEEVTPILNTLENPNPIFIGDFVEFDLKFNVNTSGYVYLRTDDPYANSEFGIASVTRSDGKSLLKDNVWRTQKWLRYDDAPDVYETFIHLFDVNSNGEYHVIYTRVTGTTGTTGTTATTATTGTTGWTEHIYRVN
jgi:hypothetical protein